MVKSRKSAITETKLDKINPAIFSALLTKLDVFTPKADPIPKTTPALQAKEKNRHWTNCYNNLRTSLTYMKLFEDIPADKVNVSYDGKGSIVDVNATDGNNLISLYGSDYPCSFCNNPVTEADDKAGNSLQCATCRLFWHTTKCSDNPDFLLTAELTTALHDAPANVCVYCPKCMLNKKPVTLSRLAEKVDHLQGMTASTQDYPVLSPSQVGVSNSSKNPPATARYTTASELKRKMDNEKDRVERTRLVRRPKGLQLSTSRLIRKSFNMDYRDIMLRECRMTAGGSILLEFEDKRVALKMDTDWKDHSFGGNEGLVSLEREVHAGIVQHVEAAQGDDGENNVVLTEAEITEEVEKTYPTATIEVFMRKGQGDLKVPTGTVKIKFASREELDSAIDKGIYMFSQKLAMEEFRFKPRAIICHHCQRYGHIALRCPHAAKCAFCSGPHSTRDCTASADPKKVKCAHCNGKHPTGDRSCKKLQEKVDELTARFHYGC